MFVPLSHTRSSTSTYAQGYQAMYRSPSPRGSCASSSSSEIVQPSSSVDGMADKIDVALSDVELLHGSAQACLSGCPGDLDWEARASQPSAVVGRTTDCRFALAALATSPVCSLQKKLQGVEVLLSPHYRTPRRRRDSEVRHGWPRRKWQGCDPQLGRGRAPPAPRGHAAAIRSTGRADER